jgi:N-acetylmuramoyl-L-alanine amidase
MKLNHHSPLADFEEAYGGEPSAATNTRKTAPKKSSSGKAPAKKNSALGKRILLTCLVFALALGALGGSLLILNKHGESDRSRSRLTSSSRSSSKGKGNFYYSTGSSGKTVETDRGDEIDPDSNVKIIYPDGYGDDYIDGDDWEKDFEEDWEEWQDDGQPGTEPNQTERKSEYKKTSSADSDLTGYTIILDPGHGGRDTGCVFPFNAPEYNECDFTLRIAKRIKSELEARGATVYMTRTDNSWVSLYNRLAQTHLICLDIAEKEGKLPFSKARANELRALLQQSIDINEDTVASGGMGIMVGSGVGEDLNDLFEMEYELDKVLFLSVHLNSSESRSQHGNQIYYVTDDSVIESERRQMRENSEFQRSDFPIRNEYYGRHNDDNNLLACCMYDNIVGNIPEFETNGHPVNADNYAVLREHGLTGVLIEVAFLSDDNDRAMLQQDQTIDTIAASVCDGSKMYFVQKGV